MDAYRALANHAAAAAAADGTSEPLITALRAVMNEAPAEALADILGCLEAERLRGQARLQRLMVASAPASAEALDNEALLTLPQVAEFMGVPCDYAYTLARQRKLPTVRLPGLDRGGRAAAGKYVRVRRSDLVAWLARHSEAPLAGYRPGVRASRRAGARGTSHAPAA